MSTEQKLEQQTAAPESPRKNDKKPVVVYIMILFIVAFLLMALSFLMHQRSNSEALGELRNSVTAMQEVQAFQEKIIDLQEQMDDLQEEVESLQSEVDNQQAHNEQLLSRLEAREKELEALAYFYTLQQQYLTRSYEGCQTTIDTMEAAGLVEVLPDTATAEEVVPPSERYYQLKDAVAARLAE